MNRHNGDNIGGFHTLYLAKVKNLTSNNFDAQKFQEIYFTAQTGQWKRNMKDSKNEVYFEHNLNFETPKYRNEVENYISETNEVALIAYIVLNNGEFVRIGSLQSPLFLTIDFESGKNYADFNSYAFKGNATEALSTSKNKGIFVTPPPPPIVIPAKGLNFNGTGNFVLVGNAGVPTVFNSPNITIDITLKSNDASSSFKAIVCKERDYGVFDYGGTIRVYDWSNNTLRDSGIATNTKKRITVVFDNTLVGGTCSFYENGNFLSSVPYKSNGGTSALCIGENRPNATNQFFNGNIQSVRLWNKVLTPTEILTPQTIKTSLLREFNFNDGQGLLLKDTSVFGVDGNLNNYLLANVTIGNTNSWTFENGTPYTG